jgi:hypothetical protein
MGTLICWIGFCCSSIENWEKLSWFSTASLSDIAHRLSRDFDISQLSCGDFFDKKILLFLSGTTKILTKDYFIYIYAFVFILTG